MIEWIRTERNGVSAMIIEGIVEQGKHLGRRLGFPTANLSPRRTEGAWPPNGVYACAAWIDGERGARPCMLNQGLHPTAPEGKPTIEAHIVGYDGDLYGKAVRVEYLRFLRAERRFTSLDALTEQLARDRQSVLEWIDACRVGAGEDAASRRAREIDWR